jgi:ATP-dependent RNA helicase SUPV3L1/SUV3
MRGLRVREEVLAGVGDQGDVTVEGHFVGKLRGLRFEPAQAGSALEDKALRAAAQRAVGPEMARRLGRLAAEPDDAFALQSDGALLWRGEAAGRLIGGTPFAPRVLLYGELGPEAARERAARRLEAFIAAEAGRRLAPLRQLETAMAEGRLKGLARGVAFRLADSGGVMERRALDADLRALSQAERRDLRTLGVRIGQFSVYLPGLLNPRAREMATAFAAISDPDWRPSAAAVNPMQARPSDRGLAAHGLRAVGSLAVPVEALERLAGILRAAPQQGGAALLSEEATAPLGWDSATLHNILRGLGYAPASRPKQGEPAAWRRRREKAQTAAVARPQTPSPFAALAALKSDAPPARRRRRKPRRQAKAAS